MTVVLSAYSQRVDKATRRISDDYLYSVEVGRDSFSNIQFSSLERVDPVEALGASSIRRKMTKTGFFRPIEPLVAATVTSSELTMQEGFESPSTAVEQRRSPVPAAAPVDGSHYTDLVGRVKQLKREKRHQEAIELLLRLVGATESEARVAGGGWGVAPWYYEGCKPRQSLGGAEPARCKLEIDF